MVAYPGYIRNIKNTPTPRVPFLTDTDRTCGITPLQMMLQRQEWKKKKLQTGLIFVEISMKHRQLRWLGQENKVNLGSFLTFMSCWSRPRSVKQEAVPGSPDSCGGRGRSKFASAHTFTENKHNNHCTSLTVTTARNH